MKLLAAFALCTGIAAAQGGGTVPSRVLSQGNQRIEIVLERSGSAGWHAVDPQMVFLNKERVRFRFRTNFDGYLYVLNRTSSGGFALIFPGSGAGRDNRVQANRDYMLPRQAGSFEILGKPGYDLLYWVVSPIPLDPSSPPPAPAPAPSAPSQAAPSPEPPRTAPVPAGKLPNLIPRCDDGILRARGDCVDLSSGPQSLGEQTTVPRAWQISMVRSRDLVFIREEKQAVVEAQTPITEPVIYEYRIAHK
jgi:hypothetical protein